MTDREIREQYFQALLAGARAPFQLPVEDFARDVGAGNADEVERAVAAVQPPRPRARLATRSAAFIF